MALSGLAGNRIARHLNAGFREYGDGSRLIVLSHSSATMSTS